ncbi:MAG TPA: hypothetical protein VJV75_01400 [Candidatus Polarisedimenticolia bacterium]|nr:hypothetical protein [Candidatus Polarisedimenticolia bacterium]
MTLTEEERWEEARRAVVRRWRTTLDRVEARDEIGTLQIVNTTDEFCREAMRLRSAAGEPASGSRCLYCREFVESGGCLGIVGALNHLVLNGGWELAARLVRERIAALEASERA